jgi:hypothetical protein
MQTAVTSAVLDHGIKMGVGDYVSKPLSMGGRVSFEVASVNNHLTTKITTAHSEAFGAVIKRADDNAKAVLEAIANQVEAA